MIVCIAEKPSVGRDIAKVLGAWEKHEGYLEGNGYQVTWALGHLCRLKEPHDYFDSWQKWSLDVLPMVPPRFGIKLIDDAGTKKQFNIVRELVSNAREVIITTGDDNINLFLAHLCSVVHEVPYVYVRFDDPDKGILVQGTAIKAIYPFQLSKDRFGLLRAGLLERGERK